MEMRHGPEIVGFDGLPVRGGIGRKPAILREPATGRHALAAAGQPLRWVAESVIQEAVARGLATILPHPLGAWSPEACVAYIDVQHLSTRWGGSLLAQVQQRSVLLAPSAWVWCEALADALVRFHDWARLFLDSAEGLLRGWDMRSVEERFAAIVTEVDRARFCIAAVGARAGDLRRRAAVLLGSAYWLRGRGDDPALWRDLALDFEPAELARIKVEMLVAPAAPVPPLPSWTDGPDFIREREPACF